MFQTSSPNNVLAQANQLREYFAGSSASTPSCMKPVPAVQFASAERHSFASPDVWAVSARIMIDIGQTRPFSVWGEPIPFSALPSNQKGLSRLRTKRLVLRYTGSSLSTPHR